MIALYILCLISIAFCGEVNKNGQETSSQNTTRLYPVRNVPFYFKNPKVQEVVSNVEKESNDEPTDVATSKDNRYTHTDEDNFKEAYKTNHPDKPSIVLNSNESESDMKNHTATPIKEARLKTTLKQGTKWRIDTSYAPSKSIDESQFRDFEREEKTKDFKPSPHLGSFYDEDTFVVPTPVHEGSFTPYKPQSLGSFEKDFFRVTYKTPVDSYQTPIDSPYRFENLPRAPDYNTESELEPRTTVEPPEKIPAGGLYKLPDPFQEKPSSDGNNEDFGLEFKDQKDNSVKKGGNPWKGFLHMVTALLPVGLVVAALTPNVITFENTDNNNPYYPSRASRRADDISTSPPRISEQCKRRLLCEIHADHNYNTNLSVFQRKPCYKLHCEDPHALNALLRWLLDQYHSHRPAAYRPADHDRRGYIIRN